MSGNKIEKPKKMLVEAARHEQKKWTIKPRMCAGECLISLPAATFSKQTYDTATAARWERKAFGEVFD